LAGRSVVFDHRFLGGLPYERVVTLPKTLATTLGFSCCITTFHHCLFSNVNGRPDFPSKAIEGVLQLISFILRCVFLVFWFIAELAIPPPDFWRKNECQVFAVGWWESSHPTLLFIVFPPFLTRAKRRVCLATDMRAPPFFD